jgi:hypothetical protein
MSGSMWALGGEICVFALCRAQGVVDGEGLPEVMNKEVVKRK